MLLLLAGTMNVDEFIIDDAGNWSVSNMQSGASAAVSVDDVWQLLLAAEEATELMVCAVLDANRDGDRGDIYRGLVEGHAYTIMQVRQQKLARGQHHLCHGGNLPEVHWRLLWQPRMLSMAGACASCLESAWLARGRTVAQCSQHCILCWLEALQKHAMLQLMQLHVCLCMPHSRSCTVSPLIPPHTLLQVEETEDGTRTLTVRNPWGSHPEQHEAEAQAAALECLEDGLCIYDLDTFLQ
jgi:hypothetical protein